MYTINLRAYLGLFNLAITNLLILVGIAMVTINQLVNIISDILKKLIL